MSPLSSAYCIPELGPLPVRRARRRRNGVVGMGSTRLPSAGGLVVVFAYAARVDDATPSSMTSTSERSPSSSTNGMASAPGALSLGRRTPESALPHSSTSAMPRVVTSRIVVEASAMRLLLRPVLALAAVLP